MLIDLVNVRRLVLLVAALLAAAGIVAAGTVAVTPTGATPAPVRHSLSTGQALYAGTRLVSPHGTYRAAVETTGRFVVRTHAGRAVWTTPRTTHRSRLFLARTGQLLVSSQHKTRWASRTSGSGRGTVLRLHDDGQLVLTNDRLLVWTNSNLFREKCPSARGRTFDVDISAQTARMCRNGQQVRVTRVTTGAVAKGFATPRGRWHVQAKIRNTTLRPATGGTYPVKYWVPYDGAYGVHDSSWQKFAYGSPKYRKHGSHGCTHMPARAMAWFYSWVRVGSTVTVHR